MHVRIPSRVAGRRRAQDSRSSWMAYARCGWLIGEMMMRGLMGARFWAMAWLCVAPMATAFDGPVEKKVFTLATYTTVGGKTIKNVRVGYETYGTLNAAGDNAIFIPHFFTANSHAAGKYKPTDA